MTPSALSGWCRGFPKDMPDAGLPDERTDNPGSVGGQKFSLFAKPMAEDDNGAGGSVRIAFHSAFDSGRAKTASGISRHPRRSRRPPTGQVLGTTGAAHPHPRSFGLGAGSDPTGSVLVMSSASPVVPHTPPAGRAPRARTSLVGRGLVDHTATSPPVRSRSLPARPTRQRPAAAAARSTPGCRTEAV